MASDLTNIYDLLAAVNMSFTDAAEVAQTVGVLKYDTMKQSLTGVTLPVRVLWLIRPGVDDAGVSPVVLKGTTSTDIAWVIHDTMYLKRSGQAFTLADATHDLLLYLNRYTAQMAAARFLSKAPSVVVSGWSYHPGIYVWGDVPYVGVDVELTVRELT